MDANRFDAVSKLFAASRLSRREAMVKGGTALAATGLAAAGLSRVAAQDATPATAEGEDGPPELLFIQSFQSGTVAADAANEGRFTVTLEQGLGQTIYFADRPSREVGAMPTEAFLEWLGFPDDNPPNAALVVDSGAGETDFAVIELFDPAYDTASHTATYSAQVLDAWDTTVNVGFEKTTTDLASLASAFGSAHLFIDGLIDCPNVDMQCYAPGTSPTTGGPVGSMGIDVSGGFCQQLDFACYACNNQNPGYWADQCNQRFPDACKGGCNIWNFCSRDAVFGDTLCGCSSARSSTWSSGCSWQ